MSERSGRLPAERSALYIPGICEYVYEVYFNGNPLVNTFDTSDNVTLRTLTFDIDVGRKREKNVTLRDYADRKKTSTYNDVILVRYDSGRRSSNKVFRVSKC